jgi:broad specificity phosphatase PhoE
MAQDDTGNQDITQKPQPYPDSDSVKTDTDEKPKPRTFRPGDLSPFWYSPQQNVLDDLSEKAKNEVKRLVDEIGNKDVAARRWEVEQSWEARLFDRGYQYLLPRRGGGWILPPFATDYNRTSSKKSGKFYGYETNIYATYGEIITAALTRDVPGVRFEPKNPESDIDVTAKEAATRYAKCFGRSNDLLALQQQMVYYLRTDGRSVIVTDHIIDRQRFGSLDPLNPVNPETETAEEQALLYLVRHGETPRNEEGITRGQSDVGLDPHGQQESSDAGSYLKGKSIGRIISSPLPRAVESAERIAQITGVPVEMDDRFAARDIGDLEGQASEDVGEDFEESSENPDEPLPGGGESQNDLDSRVQEAILDQLQTTAAQPTAIVTHDSVISSAFRAIHGEEYVPPTDLVDPGGIAGIFAAPGGGFTIRPVFPTTAEHGAVPTEESEPRGEEVAEVYGKLEAKVPINAQSQADFPWMQVSREFDYAFVKGMFPEYADKIKPGSAGAGENELDRIARINACLALEASYVTGDSMVRDCTVQRTWMRPGYFMSCEDTDVRDELFKYFPNGCLAIMAGEAMVLARNENMDDHCTTVQAFPGSGMNRLALCSKLLSLQKRVNNWIDLWNDFFIRTIPNRIYDLDMYNPEAIQDQPQMPGDSIFVKRSGANLTQPIETSVFVEPTPTHQASMPQAIQMWLTDLPQLLSGAIPSLFGAQSNVDTINPSSGVAMALTRDQALARLSTPWHAIMMATCNYFRQAVQLAAKCRKEPIRMAGQPGEAVRIELADMKGNVLCYPEESYDIPESWNQRQARYQGLITEAATNPYLAQLLSSPQNAKIAHDAAGMEEFIIPQADSWEKQLGEFEVLLKSSPIPNPQKIQAQQQIDQVVSGAKAVPPQAIPPAAVSGVDQAIQQIQAMPDMVSSVQIDPQVEDSATESACCAWWLNSAEGRKYKNGTPEERDGYQNVRLHKLEHDAAMKNNVPPAPQKPMSVSANIKDMPPRAAAAELTKRGLPAAPQEIAAERSNTNG